MRQHGKPVLIYGSHAEVGSQSSLAKSEGAFSEADLQVLIQQHPECLPISDIDPLFSNPVPLCMELSTNAGPIDNLFVTPTGLPIIVECKLWRNPEGRREVVGQILDYAKELSRWSCSDLQREVAKRTGISDNPIILLVRQAGFDVNEVEFNDALTINLRKGRFLLLIVGDGIREGVEAISEYLQDHANLNFTLGLVELPIFEFSSGHQIVAPRVLVRTKLIERHVVSLPDGFAVAEEGQDEAEVDTDPVSRINFWRALVAGLEFDDPEQKPPKATNNGSIYLSMPAPGGVIWLTVYRMEASHRAGIYLSYTRDSLGSRIVERLLEDWDRIKGDLGGTVYVDTSGKDGRKLILDHHTTGNWAIPEEREKMFDWLRCRANDFVNVLRPRIKSLAADLDQLQ